MTRPIAAPLLSAPLLSTDLLPAAFLAAVCLASPARAEISMDVLLDEMVDLHRLTRLPDPAYTTRQFASYDRASTTHSDHAGWFANGDAGKFLREEERDGRTEHVLMDAEGPGAIVRIWSANPTGTIRFYLDGAEAPALEADLAALLGGKVEGFPVPLAGMRGRGWNLYFPIPYARHCKVTNDKPGFYYHVNYRTYPAGTPVRTFVRSDLAGLEGKIRLVAERLSKPRGGSNLPEDRARAAFDTTVPPGTAKLWEGEGRKEICGFLVRIDADDPGSAVRQVVLEMTFDGRKTVECPLGDFFGTAPGLIPYESLPLGISETEPREMWCHWRMPFREKAVISVRNQGEATVRLHGGVSTVPCSWDDRTLHFHAKWRIEKAVPTRPMTDWRHLAANGAGRFVGGALHLVNPVKIWWGEGDEKIYVDGEVFPSHLGTGSEDYYGYAWGSPERFVHAYHNQPKVDGPGNYGNTSVNRFHIIDDIPFTRSFTFDMENWHWDPAVKTARAAVSYWYARPGSSDFFGPIVGDDTVPIEVPEWKAARVPGAIEGEEMEVVAKTGSLETQSYGFMSNEEHLWWTGGSPGDRLTLAFEAPESGERTVLVRFTKARDYAMVQCHVNGRKAGPAIDLYDPRVVGSEPISLGKVPILKGRNTLTIEIVGANEKAVKSYMVGLDYLLLE